MVAAENTPENRVSAGERYAAVYEINLSRCIFCGYCEVACPFDAITMGHDYELSDYDRTDLIFTKEMLLAEPLERTPLRNEGGDERASCSSSPRIGAIAGAVGVVMLRNPFYSVLALVGAPAVAGGAVPAAARGVRGGGAGRRVRGRGDGAVRVRGRLRRRATSEPIGERLRGARPGAARSCASARAMLGGALLVELLIALLGTGLEASTATARRYAPGPKTFGTPAYIGKLLLTRFLLVFEVASFLLLIAAVGAVVLARRRGRPRRGRRGRARRVLTPLDLLRPREHRHDGRGRRGAP